MGGTGQPIPADSGLHGVAERIREAVRRHPRKMTMQLAPEYGVPEVEVIRAFPCDWAVELDSARWEDPIRSFETVVGEVVRPARGRRVSRNGGQTRLPRNASYLPQNRWR